MKQSTLSQKEQEVLKQYCLKEIQKQLKPYTISHTNYFDGELTITNLETIADLIKLEFEHSAATNRIYLRDIPDSQVALNEQDLPKFIKCINLNDKNMQDIIDETGYVFTIITQPIVEIEFPMLGGIGELKLDYVHYKRSECKYFACDDGENWSKDNNKRIVSDENRATLVSKMKQFHIHDTAHFHSIIMDHNLPELMILNGTAGNTNYETQSSDLHTNKSTKLFQI